MGMGAASVHYGIGRHVVYLEPVQLLQATKWNRVGQMPLVISTMFTKLSISLFLYRIFATKRVWRWALYPIIVLNIIGNLASFTTILPQCSPVDKLWNPTVPGNCWDPKTQIDIGLFQGGKSFCPKHFIDKTNISQAVSVFCDFVLAFLPIVFLWNIHIKAHIKLGICVLMGLGFL